MAIVKFVNEEKFAKPLENETLLELARRCGVFMESPCQGRGTCGKCKVKILKGMENLQIEKSPKSLSQEEISKNYVLACTSHILGNVEVETLQGEDQKSLKILSQGKDAEYEIHNSLTKEFVGDVTNIYFDGEKIGEEVGDTSQNIYGLAVDIGTTTLVAALIDCLTGAEICSTSALNPQTEYAQDVISRINYTSETENGLQIMFESVQNAINLMLEELCKTAGISTDLVEEVVYSGNAAMLHLASNVNPYSLGRYPYLPAIKGGNWISAKDNNLKIAEFGKIYLPPLISSFVGADITSGVLICDLEKLAGNTLFIDIGTNGEMVMASNGTLAATSTAAGPAFEGMNITFGMRASAGAVEYFNIDDEGEIEVKTIEGALAVGICGSGLFDITAELVRTGVITKSGKLAKATSTKILPKLAERICEYNEKPAFKVVEGVYLTQLDIRQIQLAKAAIRAGVEALLELLDIPQGDLDKVQIAGSFGYHLQSKSIVNMGIIPAGLEEKIEFVGNTSKTGAQEFLLNKEARTKMETMVAEIKCLELAEHKDFEQLFVTYMGF